jgi:hypothetical protein
MKRTIEEALLEARERIIRDDFVRAIFTGKRKDKSPEFQRVDLRPVEIKGEILIQSVAHDGKKDFTKNFDVNSPEVNELLNSGFANLIIDSTSESYQVQITKKEEAIVGVSKTRLERALDHDRQKERVLPESHPLFRALGFSDSAGRINPTARDKYIQIDQLLRILAPTLTSFESGSKIRLVDLASGSAALTLAVHTYLSESNGILLWSRRREILREWLSSMGFDLSRATLPPHHIRELTSSSPYMLVIRQLMMRSNSSLLAKLKWPSSCRVAIKAEPPRYGNRLAISHSLEEMESWMSDFLTWPLTHFEARDFGAPGTPSISSSSLVMSTPPAIC